MNSYTHCLQESYLLRELRSWYKWIQKEFDKMSLTDALVKRKIKSNTEYISKYSEDKKSSSTCGSQGSFTRLTAVAGREENEEQHFDYEFTTEPMKLFKNKLIREPHKPTLRKPLLKEDVFSIDMMKDECMFIVDGGILVHRV